MEAQRLRTETADLFDAPPKAAQGPEFRERREDFGIRREQKRDVAARDGRRKPGLVQPAQIGNAGRKHTGELLGGSRAGIMIRPAIGKKNGPREPSVTGPGNEFAKRGPLETLAGRAAGPGKAARWVEPEIGGDSGTRQPPVRRELGQKPHRIWRSRAGIEPEIDEIELDSGQGRFERVRAEGQAEARGGLAREHDRQPRGAAFEIEKREAVRLAWARVIEPLRHAPRAGLTAQRAGARAPAARGQRLDPHAFGRHIRKRFETCASKRLCGELAPDRFGHVTLLSYFCHIDAASFTETSHHLAQAGDRARNVVDFVVTGLFPRISEEFLAGALHFARAETGAGQLRGETHQAATAAQHTHKAAEETAARGLIGVARRSRVLAARNRFEQPVDLVSRTLFPAGRRG